MSIITDASSYGGTGAISVPTMAWFSNIIDVLTHMGAGRRSTVLITPTLCTSDGSTYLPLMSTITIGLPTSPAAVTIIAALMQIMDHTEFTHDAMMMKYPAWPHNRMLVTSNYQPPPTQHL